MRRVPHAYTVEYCRPKDGRPGSHNWNPEDYESDAWYDKWCSASLLRHEGEIYRCGTTASVYYEGMGILPEEVFQRYEHGRSEFAVEVPGTEVDMMAIMQACFHDVRNHVHRRRQHVHNLERISELGTKPAAELSDYQLKSLAEARDRVAKWVPRKESDPDAAHG